MQADLPIDFAVVGGSLAGLACAIALRRVGHRVTVFEESDLANPVSPMFTTQRRVNLPTSI